MSQYRQNQIILIIGKRGTGKTVIFKGDKSLGIPGLIDVFVSQSKKVLIADTIEHPSYTDIKFIHPKNITLKWNKGVYKTFVNIDEIEDLLKHIRDNFYNGALCIEDAGKHQQGKLSRALKALIGDSKQKNVDIVFMFHEWSFVPLDLLRYVDLIVMCKTNESPEVREGRFNVPMSQVMQCYNDVKSHPSNYFYKILDNYAG